MYRGRSKASFEFMTVVAMALILLVLPLLGGCANMSTQEKKTMALTYGVLIGATIVAYSLADDDDCPYEAHCHWER